MLTRPAGGADAMFARMTGRSPRPIPPARGALYWALDEFWVRPGWDGGDPRPQPPVFQKGLVSYDGVPKPAFADVQRWYTQTPPLVPAG